MRSKFFKYIFAAAAMTFAACGGGSDEPLPDDPEPVPPVPGGDTPTETVVKTKAMWIDCQANFDVLSKKAGIDSELKKIKDAGLNTIYLDVKSGNGYALYKSDFIPYCNKYLYLTAQRDYDDYLAYFLEKCEEMEMDVIASVVATGWGVNYGGIQQGFIYDDPGKWLSKVQVRCDADNPDRLSTMMEDELQPVIMLDPADPEVQDLIVRTVRELVTKYPKLKGVCIDYMRYGTCDTGGWYGMSDFDLQDYSRYWNEGVPQRSEIIESATTFGPKFAKWIEYRSMVVTNVMERIHDTVKSINPDCEIHLWSSSHWDSRFYNGQNWASRKYTPPVGIQYTSTYSKTGFAHLLDVFVTGAYVEDVWSSDLPGSIWTVEHFVKDWKTYLKGDCRCYGSIAAYLLDDTSHADATYLCLNNTDGYMTFELSHVNTRNLWDSIKKGIKRYEKK